MTAFEGIVDEGSPHGEMVDKPHVEVVRLHCSFAWPRFLTGKRETAHVR